MKNPLSYEIVKELEKNPLGMWGGQIEDAMRSFTGSKGDTTARRLRELVEDGVVVCEKRMPPKGKRAVNFYYLPKIEVPKVLPQFARTDLHAIEMKW